MPGNLLFVSNYLHHFVAGTMNFSVPNFRIWSISVDAGRVVCFHNAMD